MPASELRAAIRDHFTIRRESSGTSMIDVGWPRRSKPFYGEMAKFTFRAPTDPETLARMGIVGR